MVQTKDQLLTVQKDQMIHGISSDDAGIGQYRSEEYANQKYDQSSLAGYGNVDLRLTGAFYNAMKTTATGEGLVIYSTDEKAQSLEEKYGSAIYSLSKKYRPNYIQELQPVFITNLVDSLRE